MDSGSTILILLAFIQATCGQTVTVVGPPAVVEGSNTVYTCTLTGGSSTPNFIWRDVSLDNVIISVGDGPGDVNPKHDNFYTTVDGTTSTMTITNTLIADEGEYRCSVGAVTEEVVLIVEVQSARTVSLTSTVTNNTDIYEATCEALGGKPNETITWAITGGSPCADPVETYLTAAAGLFSKKSVCTFQADSGNNGQTLQCVINGHQVSTLNGEATTTLNIHNAPTGTVVVVFQEPDPDLRVSCNIADQPTPNIRNYYIYSNDTLIHESTTGVDFIVVAESDFDLFTDFKCVAGNYIGNITSELIRYDPDSTTTPPPTTVLTTPEPPPGSNTTDASGVQGLGAGAIAGIAVGAIVVIIIIILLIIKFVLKPECLSLGSSSGGGGASSKKHGSSSVGSSNGNEKNDVEAPLNGVNEVVTKDKMKPTPTPRVQSSVPHTNDNPGHEEYAMVDRKSKPGGGGDMPDTRGNGAGQNEPAGPLYADLDLSTKAGHHDREVPQNPDNVVVYSSILV